MHADKCEDVNCDQSVMKKPVKITNVDYPINRWYITPGHYGYNSPSNKKTGYQTEGIAKAAIRRYAKFTNEIPKSVQEKKRSLHQTVKK